MLPAFPPAVPCGRNELLEWINHLCGAEYPSVESFRDGAAYCTVIEAGASRLGKNFSSAGFPDWNGAVEKAAKAKSYLNQVDWSATAHVYEYADPAQDTAHVRDVCNKNMKVLQKMLGFCVFSEFSIEINPDRLAGGKLQEHVQFLSWLCNFIRKILTYYTRSKIVKRGSGTTRSVEGVRKNRAMLLLEEKRYEESGFAAASDQPISRAPLTARGAKKVPMPLFSAEEDTPRKRQIRDSAPVHSSIQPQNRAKSVDSSVVRSRDLPRHVDPCTSRSSLRGGERCWVIPETHKNSLIELRGCVEEIEEIVLLQHQSYQQSIVPLPDHSTEIKDTSQSRERIISLTDLGKLLEERDSLALVYSEVEEIYRSHSQRGVVTPLLMHIGAVLYPQPMS